MPILMLDKNYFCNVCGFESLYLYLTKKINIEVWAQNVMKISVNSFFDLKIPIAYALFLISFTYSLIYIFVIGYVFLKRALASEIWLLHRFTYDIVLLN